jgi:hypothetical protein
MYQSLDAIDGKQARRTGMAGPLGEMFDHGCDAINTTVRDCRSMRLPRSSDIKRSSSACSAVPLSTSAVPTGPSPLSSPRFPTST